ncbi:MAG TPA: IS21 family transposase [Herpetosiphonaceae bacterium]|nr:IS21 family transposase [Herpetosiphonaceae bacterium]
MDIRELLRHIQAEPSDRAVQRATGAHRQTVQRYRSWATAQGLLDHPLPPVDQLQRLIDQTLELPPPPQVVSSVEPYRTLVSQLRAEGTEVAAIWQRLKERGFSGSYAAVYRFVRTLDDHTPDVVVRVERAPAEEAQVDFGAAGRMIDPATGTLRKAWAFVMTLAWSRHQYVEFVFDQKVGTWLLLHRHAFEFFGGVPQRLVIDNLKAGITQASWDDPQVQHAYRECAEHYGFLIAPCRPRTPEHKGKVEQGGVHYVTRNFLGGRTPTLITQANQEVRQWCLTTAGARIHGTTREPPLRRFQQTEQAQLRPLPQAPYDVATWKLVTLYRDCHLTFDNAYYSAPFRLVGQHLHVCGGSRTVRIYTPAYELVATHPRAQQPGERHTHPDHLPPEKLAGLLLGRPAALAAAADIGPATAQVVQRLLDDPVVDRLPTVRRLLRLRDRWGDAALEAACGRALHFDDPTYTTIKRTLVEGRATEPVPEDRPVPPARTFIRSASDLLGHLFGGL